MPLLCRWHDLSPPAGRTVTGHSPGTGGGHWSPPRPSEVASTLPGLDQCGSRFGFRPREGPSWPLLLFSMPGPPSDAHPAPVGVVGHLLGPTRRQAYRRAWTNAGASLAPAQEKVALALAPLLLSLSLALLLLLSLSLHGLSPNMPCLSSSLSLSLPSLSPCHWHAMPGQ